jgi:ACR3 family arsenite efflux pump ArsB
MIGLNFTIFFLFASHGKRVVPKSSQSSELLHRWLCTSPSFFGDDNDQALAATFRLLIGVPVLLDLVGVIKWYVRRKKWQA